MSKLTKAKFMDALKDSNGVVSNIARACDCSPTAINKFIERSNGDIKQALINEKNKTIASVQNKLMSIIENGEEDSATTLNAVKFFLERKGGFIEKQELKQENTYPTAIQLHMDTEGHENPDTQETVLPIENNEKVYL